MKNNVLNLNFESVPGKKIFWGAFGILFLFAILLSFLSNNLFLALIIALILIWASAKRIEIGLFFLTFYIPFEPFLLKFTSDEIYPVLKFGTEIIILILFLITMLKHWRQEDCRPAKKKEMGQARNLNETKGNKWHFRYIKTPVDIPLAIFIFITLISAILNLENPAYWFLGLRQILRYVLLFYIIVYSKLAPKVIKQLLVLLAFLLVVQSAIGMAQAFIGKAADDFLLPGAKREFANIVSPDYVYKFWSSGQRIFATMGRYDRLGTFLCLEICLLLGFFYETKNKKIKKILAALILFSLPTFFLTYSRMAWIGLLMAVLFINLALKRNKKFIIGIIAALIFMAGYLAVYVKANDLRLHFITDQPQMSLPYRFLSTFSMAELRNSYRGQGRLFFIVNTPRVVAAYPLFGVGLGQYGSGITYVLNNKEKYDEFGLPFGIEGTAGQIDNNWFSLWGETGTLGLVAFMAVIVSLFIESFKLYKTGNNDFIKGLALGFMGVIIAVSIQAFLGPYFEIRTLSYNFWLVGGMVVGVGISSEEDKVIKKD